MNRLAPRLLVLAAVAVLAGCGDSKEVKALDARQAKVQKRLKTQVFDKLPRPGARKVIDCAKDQPGADKVLTVRDAFLKTVVDRSSETRKRKYMPSSALTSFSMRRMAMHPRHKPKSFKKHLKRVEKMRYLGVYLTERWEPGKIKRRKIIAPAVFHGWFALFEVKTGKIVTLFPIKVRSGRTITAWRKKGRGAPWKRALRESVSKAAGQWTNTYLKQHCPQIQVDASHY